MAVTLDSRAPTLPPLLTGRAVEAADSAFDTAAAAAAASKAEAGEVLWSEALDRLDVAVVLEPEVDEGQALQVHFAFLVACADALGALGPPEMAVQYIWPDIITVNGAQAGRARVALPAATAEAAAPAWMVLGIELAILTAPDRPEPGHLPDQTTLWEEGCGDLDRTALIESIARHFLVWLNTWNEDGFRPVHEAWLARCEEYRGELALIHAGEHRKGRFVGLDEEGNLLLQSDAGTQTLDFAAAVERIGAAT